MPAKTHADLVRELARVEYVEPAEARRESTVRIVAGDVQKTAGLSDRAALVCRALKSSKFVSENHLALEKWDGPPSGMSTTVAFTYRLLPHARSDQSSTRVAVSEAAGNCEGVVQQPRRRRSVHSEGTRAVSWTGSSAP